MCVGFEPTPASPFTTVLSLQAFPVVTTFCCAASTPYNLSIILAGITYSFQNLVLPRGVEPLTPCFVDKCSNPTELREHILYIKSILPLCQVLYPNVLRTYVRLFLLYVCLGYTDTSLAFHSWE